MYVCVYIQYGRTARRRTVLFRQVCSLTRSIEAMIRSPEDDYLVLEFSMRAK